MKACTLRSQMRPFALSQWELKPTWISVILLPSPKTVTVMQYTRDTGFYRKIASSQRNAHRTTSNLLVQVSLY